jgi:hypothetical protein
MDELVTPHAGWKVQMNTIDSNRIGHKSDAGVTYSLKPALVVHGDIITAVHLVATTHDAAVTYGATSLHVGASVLLVADEIPVPARVSWSQGRRARLENR